VHIKRARLKANTVPEQVGGEVEGAGESEARNLVQPKTPTPREVELDDTDVLLPGLLLPPRGIVVAKGRTGGADQRNGVVDQVPREGEEAAEHGDSVARVEQRLSERGGDIAAAWGCGGGRG
jgi:hypothetical protein